MSDSYPIKATQPEVIEHVIRAVGGTAAVTKVTGAGVAVSRTGTGLYLLTWPETPGTHIGNAYSLAATTVAAMAGHTVSFGVYNTTAFTLAFNFYNSSFAARDLAALEWIDIVCRFKATSV